MALQLKMTKSTILAALLLLIPFWIFSQGVSCPAVVAGPDTTLNCNSCVQLRANPVSGFTTTDYVVQSIPYSPYPFNGGTSIIANQDDVWSPVLNLGFPFCFYGNSYTQSVVGSNGVITFDLGQANGYCAWPISQGIPGNIDFLNSIMGPVHDIDPGVSGSIRWSQYGVAPCRVFVVSFTNIPMFDCNNLIATQQIALYETTNIIEVYIQNKPVCSTWNAGAAIEGIQNAAGTQAVVVPGRNYPGTWTAANDAYRFVPNGAPNYTVQWFEVGNPVAIASTDTVTVCPSGSTDYYAEVVYTNCNGTTVTVRDTASITTSGSNMVITPSQVNVGCNGGNNGSCGVSVSGNGSPVSYLWTTGATTSNISNLSAGSYTVTITEQGTCSATRTIVITEPAAITMNPSQTNVLCNGGATGVASVAPTGGTAPFTYLWSTGGTSSSINNLNAGSYSVTVTDFNNCTNTATIVITQPNALTNSFNISPILCNGGNGSITAVPAGGVGGYTFLWSNAATTATINAAGGTYSVTVTDANGCQVIGNATLSNPTALSSTTSSTQATCGVNNGTATVTPSGGTLPYSYSWNNGQTTATAQNLGPGTYNVTVTDANGCTTTNSAAVGIAPGMQLQGNSSDVTCFGDNDGSVGIVVTGGTAPYSYAWSNGASTSQLSNLGPGNYSVTVTDANSCTVTQSLVVVEPALLVATATSTDILCFGQITGTASVTAVGGIAPRSFQWSTGPGLQTIGPLAAGTYSVTATDANGCVSVASTTISQPDPLTLTITGDDMVCEYDSARLFSTVGGGTMPYEYDWSSTPTSVQHNATPNLVYPGSQDLTYTLQVTDANGCKIQASHYVESNPTPDVAFVPHRREACDSMTVYFTNLSTPGASYFWEFGDGTTSTQVNPIHFYENGFWSVRLTVTTAEGCTNSYFAQDLIHIIPTPTAIFSTSPIIRDIDYFYLSDAEVTFSADVQFYSSGLWWDFGNGDSASTWQTTYAWPEPGDYTITLSVFNIFGCHTEATQSIHIIPNPGLWVPNSFTPNGDGLNDFFEVKGINIVDYEITIFDRWGKVIFFSESMDKHWNGMVGDMQAPEGVYVYKINAVNNGGEKIVRSGSITVVK